MFRRLSIVFTAGVVLLCRCFAADSGETIGKTSVGFLSPEMRRMNVEEQALREELRSLPPIPEREITARLGHHSGYCKEFAFASAAPETVRMGTGVGE